MLRQKERGITELLNIAYYAASLGPPSKKMGIV